MGHKTKPLKLLLVLSPSCLTVFLSSLMIVLVHTTNPPLYTEMTTEIVPNTMAMNQTASLPLTSLVPTQQKSSSVWYSQSTSTASMLSRILSTTSLPTSMPSSTILQSTQSLSSSSAITGSSIPSLPSTTQRSSIQTTSPTDQGFSSVSFIERLTSVYQTSTARASPVTSQVPSTQEVITTSIVELKTTFSQELSTPEMQTESMTYSATSPVTTVNVSTSSTPLVVTTITDRTSLPLSNTYATPGAPSWTTRSSTTSTTGSLFSTIPFSKSSSQYSTTEEPVPGTSNNNSEVPREPLFTIPQLFAIFFGTFLTIFLIFLTNIWYKSKMSPDNTKPSIELIKDDKKNDRPKSWQDTNMPLDFMSLHIKLPMESKDEMRCAENLAFEGESSGMPGASSEFKVKLVTLTRV